MQNGRDVALGDVGGGLGVMSRDLNDLFQPQWCCGWAAWGEWGCTGWSWRSFATLMALCSYLGAWMGGMGGMGWVGRDVLRDLLQPQ